MSRRDPMPRAIRALEVTLDALIDAEEEARIVVDSIIEERRRVQTALDALSPPDLYVDDYERYEQDRAFLNGVDLAEVARVAREAPRMSRAVAELVGTSTYLAQKLIAMARKAGHDIPKRPQGRRDGSA